ncbi:MAG: LysR family transcriptional regulator [Xanthobacteraceae bacterium]|nr:LysR family transcriptional regulator [Xanthobacteraceae bacterium]
MDLRLLRYFLVVAEELHVTRAAARLGIQQAPLSQQIKRFEQSLGAQLFRRKPRGVELTEAGVALRDEAASIFASVDRAVDTVSRVSRGELGDIRIGLTTSACFHPLPPKTIRSYRRTNPQVKIQFEQDSTPGLIERLQAGRVDVAFIRTAIGTPAGVTVVPLIEEPMVVALPARHPLAGNGRGLTLKSLAHEKFIGYPRAAGAGLYDSVIAACIVSGFNPDIAYEAPQIVSTLNLVAAGMGISVVPSSMQRLRLDAVVYRPLTGPHNPKGQLNLAVRDDALASSATAFLALVRKGAGAVRSV